MKLLFVDPLIHTDYSKRYSYYDGLYNALQKRLPCELHSAPWLDLNIIPNTPDILVFGLGWFNNSYYGKIPGIDNFKGVKVCQLFKPQNNLKHKLRFCVDNKIDLIVTPVPCYRDYEKETGIKTCLLPYGFDPTVFYFDQSITRLYDIGFSGALHSSKHYELGAFAGENLRSRAFETFRNLPIKYFWNGSDSVKPRIKAYNEYANKIKQSKIWLATSAAYGDITPRFFEIGACQTALLCNEIPETYKNIFASGINCIEFKNDMSDFTTKFREALESWEMLAEALHTTMMQHTWDHRAEEFSHLL